MFNLHNRRYVGSKYKLLNWIKDLVEENCKGSSLFDVFAGTGIVTSAFIDKFNEYYINDFLPSNYIIYNGFFLQENYSESKVNTIIEGYNNKSTLNLKENYVSQNFGNKFFSMNDSRLIGYIREDIENKYNNKEVNEKEYYILISSLLYSIDRIANTVGHYDAYIKNHQITDSLTIEPIMPIKLNERQSIKIFKEDANELVKKITSDIAFIDPPYNSRQYSRFYHVLDNIAQWKKPQLYGVAMKPLEENMSDYCRVSAPIKFKELIDSLDAKYIVVTYNNTYNSKSSSSRNKITLEEITDILRNKGKTEIFEKSHQFFNAGKTDFKDHMEFLFITRSDAVGKK
ncbi:DNA adenine methylase [Sedimentibacter sp.]|uniref:DNA adenine methylase n=1 Tax=Sedimentibacter sp. TaxID=1960295 RepID=UPI0028A20982|nr:DNA adenine methylase [Sedimentibacter sp.]